MYNPYFFNRTLAAVLGQGETEGWESWKNWKCDYLFSLLNHPCFVCGCCLRHPFLPTSLCSHFHLQDSVGRKGSSSIAEKGWPAWWQMGVSVGRLGWDERVSGGSLSSPLHTDERMLFFGEHTCQEQSCAAPCLPQLAALKSMNLMGLSIPLICGGKNKADAPPWIPALWLQASSDTVDLWFHSIASRLLCRQASSHVCPLLPFFLDGNLEQGLDSDVHTWGTANYPQQWIPASQLLLANFLGKKPDRIPMLKHTVAYYFVKSKYCFW